MFEPKDEIGDAVDAIYDIVKDMKRGDILGHERIMDVLGVEPHRHPWGHVMNRVRTRLEGERGIATKPVYGVGYELLTIAKQLEVPSWRVMRGIRQFRRGYASLNALPDKSLTLHERRVRAFRSDTLEDLQREARKDLKALQEQLKPTSSVPRRPLFDRPEPGNELRP